MFIITRTLMLISATTLAVVGLLAGRSPDGGTGRSTWGEEITISREAVEENRQANEDFERITAASVSAVVIRGSAQQVETTTTIPEPPPAAVWNGPIPEYYGPGSGCTPAEADMVAGAMWAEGASDDSVLWMLDTISRESTCKSSARNLNNRTRDDSWGLCQINVLAGHFSTGGIVESFDRYRFEFDFQHNVEACARLWAVCGRGPWTKGDYGCRTPEELRGS